MFSHAQTVVVCAGCSTVLCQPTGGRARFATFFCASEKRLQFLSTKSCPSILIFSLIQKPFCVSVSPLWRLQRQKGLKLVRLTGELGSVTQFHIAKLAHTWFKIEYFDLQRIMISSTRILCHIFNPPLCRLTEGCSFRRKQH